MPDTSVELYGHVYGDFASAAETAVRRETYGEDIGQSSWLTVQEWLEFADLLGVGVGKESEVLEVGSGSGGPAVYLAEKMGCRITGVDINEHGVRNEHAVRGIGKIHREREGQQSDTLDDRRRRDGKREPPVGAIDPVQRRPDP